MSNRNMDIIGALDCYIEGQSKYLCFANLFNEERNAKNVKEVRNSNTNYQELGAVSSESGNLSENSKTVNYNKEEVCNVKASENIKSEFNNWCKNRKKEYLFRYSKDQLNKSDKDIIPKAKTTETIEDTLCQKSPSNSKNKCKGILFEAEDKQVHESISTIKHNVSFKMYKRETRSDKFLGKQLSCKDHMYAAKTDGKNEFKNMHREKKRGTFFNANEVDEQSLESVIDKTKGIKLEKQIVSKEYFLNDKSYNDNLKKKSHSKKNEQRSIHDSSNCVYRPRNDHSYLIKKNTILCVRITDDKSNEFLELITDSMTILSRRRTLPKLSANLPDVDSESTELVNYSADAMNVILKFAFYTCFRIPLVPATVGMELLAIARSWDIKDFYNSFQEHFVQNVLTSKNVNLVFSYANYYNLKDICDACKDIAHDKTALNPNVFRKTEKKCRISIFTHVEPLEMSIPFEPVEVEFSNSFQKEIQNTFTFKVISGRFTITGFQIHLNEKYVLKRFTTEENRKMLTIDYDIKKISGTQVITFDGSMDKPMRAIMTIFFKKDLILNPKEKCEISIRTEIEPFMCSARANRNISVKNAIGEINLAMESNRRIENSDRKFILAGSFYYHVHRHS